MTLTQPKTENEFKQYYNLRWRLLRKAWKQPEGSEQDKDDDVCYHIMATINDEIVGIARLEFPTINCGQLRYMAVEEAYQGQGIGRLIVEHIEQYSKENHAHELFLHARENAVGFYETLGYHVTEKSYLLFNAIQHYKMTKKLD